MQDESNLNEDQLLARHNLVNVGKAMRMYYRMLKDAGYRSALSGPCPPVSAAWPMQSRYRYHNDAIMMQLQSTAMKESVNDMQQVCAARVE